MSELKEEFRAGQNATDMVDQAAADLLGVNRTDARCIDILDRLGRITAGRLAEESGLTTGAVTAMIDRLERAGHVRRVRDENDRRRVMVEVTPRTRRAAARLYEPLNTRWAEASKDFSDEQLRFLLDFARLGRQINLELAGVLQAKLEARERAASRRAREAGAA
jgi:DNA-binding MarR family transcriptional regulator